MTPTLTIAIPTIGRQTLQATLDSIARQQLVPGDRVLVVLDTFNEPPRPDVAELVASYGAPFELHLHDGGVHFFGNPQFNYAISITDTDYFCGLGDDDIYVDGAIERLRAHLTGGQAVLFQFLSPWRDVLWDVPELQEAHISGCCMAAPHSALVPVSTASRIEVDFDWIVAVVEQSCLEPKWLDDCLIIARPELRNGELAHRGVTTCEDCGEVRFLEDMVTASACNQCAVEATL